MSPPILAKALRQLENPTIYLAISEHDPAPEAPEGLTVQVRSILLARG